MNKARGKVSGVFKYETIKRTKEEYDLLTKRSIQKNNSNKKPKD